MLATVAAKTMLFSVMTKIQNLVPFIKFKLLKQLLGAGIAVIVKVSCPVSSWSVDEVNHGLEILCHVHLHLDHIPLILGFIGPKNCLLKTLMDSDGLAALGIFPMSRESRH